MYSYLPLCHRAPLFSKNTSAVQTVGDIFLHTFWTLNPSSTLILWCPAAVNTQHQMSNNTPVENSRKQMQRVPQCFIKPTMPSQSHQKLRNRNVCPDVQHVVVSQSKL